MTFTLKTSGSGGSTKDELDTAEQAAEKFAEVRDAADTIKVHIDSEADAPGDLTPSERRIIEKEGRSAAESGRPADACPYQDDEERRGIWMNAYSGGSQD
jgi:ribosome modulation factor